MCRFWPPLSSPHVIVFLSCRLVHLTPQDVSTYVHTYTHTLASYRSFPRTGLHRTQTHFGNDPFLYFIEAVLYSILYIYSIFVHWTFLPIHCNSPFLPDTLKDDNDDALMLYCCNLLFVVNGPLYKWHSSLCLPIVALAVVNMQLLSTCYCLSAFLSLTFSEFPSTH